MGSGYSVPALAFWYRTGKATYGHQGFVDHSKNWKESDFPATLKGQVHVVTGANAGLGYSVAQKLARLGASTHLVCRNEERGRVALEAIRSESGNDDVHLHVLDVSSPAAVKAFAADWNAKVQLPIHSLILNAGNLAQKRELNSEGMEVSWAAAICQSYLLAGLLMPHVARASQMNGDARVIHVSSGGGLTVKADIDDPWAENRKFDGTLQYAFSKRTQIELNDLWAQKLGKSSRILMASMHPGWSETPGVTQSLPEFAEQNQGTLRTPDEGADTIFWLAAAKRDAIQREAAASSETESTHPNGAAPESGLFWFDRSPSLKHFPLAWTSLSGSDRDRLWKKCSEWFGFAWEGSAQQAIVNDLQSSVAAPSASASASTAASSSL